MITSTRDPISMNDVTDLEHAPYVIEGEGPNALKIFWTNLGPIPRFGPPSLRAIRNQ